MHNFLKIIVTILIFLLPNSIFSQEIRERDRKELVQLSDDYLQAIISSDGENLLPLISSSTLDFYESLQNTVLHFDKESLLKKELHIILLATLTKSIFTEDQIRGLTPEEFYVKSFSGQASNLSSETDLKIEDFIPNGNVRIIIQYMETKSESPVLMPFIKEDYEWKADVPDFWRIYLGTLIYPIYEKLIDQGHSKEKAIEMIVESQLGINENDPLKPLQYWDTTM
ncbi:MAG: hypothetical protein WD357_00545 [Gracilimonas sp.]